jgi:hypothetical protein
MKSQSIFGFCRLWAIVVLTVAESIVATSLIAQAQDQKPAPGQRSFSSPEEAIQALRAATQANDRTALHEIFGPEIDNLLTGDPTQDAKNHERFAASLAEACHPVPEGNDTVILEVGTNNWPTPIPLVKSGGQWHFDTAAGKEEIIARHVGRDELHAIAVCRAYAKEQHQDTSVSDASAAPRPSHGYSFRILTRQGSAAPGGKKNYVSHGRLENGFALVAYPEHWDKSGIMTFMVGPDGIVYERNFGEKTSSVATKIKAYNPDNDWNRVQEEGILSRDEGR